MANCGRSRLKQQYLWFASCRRRRFGASLLGLIYRRVSVRELPLDAGQHIGGEAEVSLFQFLVPQ